MTVKIPTTVIEMDDWFAKQTDHVQCPCALHITVDPITGVRMAELFTDDDKGNGNFIFKVELPIVRYVPTYLTKEGLRVLACPAQGRATHETPESAQQWIDDVLGNTDRKQLLQIFGTIEFEVRPVECWPGHLDPVRTVFNK